MAITVTIRKSTWTPSKPWCADVELDGFHMKSWASEFRSKTRLLQHIAAVMGHREYVIQEDRRD